MRSVLFVAAILRKSHSQIGVHIDADDSGQNRSLFGLMSRSFLEVMATRYRDAAGDSGGHVQPAVDDTCLFGESRLVHSSLVLRRTVGAGRGWFAIHDLEAGTVLWNERPLNFAATREGLVRKVDKMLWRHEGLCRKPMAESRGAGIVAANYFDFGMYGSYLFEQTSLLNHSCCPNASVRVVYGESVASETVASVHVARHVDADEQLCISYSSKALWLPTDARRELIQQKWGFHCRCNRCEGTLPLPEQERWALLEQAAAAADALNCQTVLQTDHRDPAHMALQARAAALVAEWLPSLAEGERFAEHIERYGAG